MKTVIQVALVWVVLVGFYGCKPIEKTDENLTKELETPDTYRRIADYSSQIGIDTSSLKNKSAWGLLEEISYGHKPQYVRYTAKVKPIDSTHIREIGWALVDKKGKNAEKVLPSLEPSFPSYTQLKQHYRRLIDQGQTDSAAIVAESLNAYRWINRQSQDADRLVIVNTRGAYLKGLDASGNQQIGMRVVVGKTSSPTPGIDTYATNVIMYPYWNVPKNIALKEILPKIKQDADYLARNSIEVINKEGEVVDNDDVDWDDMTPDNFPYRFRQENGEGNSLGLMKVNIKNPLAIYLHDTNARTLFDSTQRWRSHGCVRLQNPAQLANFLAGKDWLKEDFINEPQTHKEPQSNPLKKRIPVFILYLGADVNENGQLVFFKDVYQWERKWS